MSKLTEKMMKMESFKSRVPATKEQIANAEKSLGLSFAKEYKEYLAELGCASIYGHEFTGICKAARLDVVSVTTEQKNCIDGIPDDWYVIEETNIDGVVIWQNSCGKIYASAPKKLDEEIASSLADYLEQVGI